MTRKILFNVLSLFILPNILIAQETTGGLEGRIIDENNHPVAAADIIVESPALQGTRGVVSSESGYFNLTALPVGVYTLNISHVAFQSYYYRNLPVSLGKTLFIGEIKLQPRAIEVDAVTIVENKPLIDPASTAVGANISSETFEQLPIERSYKSVLALAPHANTSYLGDDVNIAGSTGQENIYFIDGMNVTDPYGAVGGTDLPYNFVKELEVMSGSYPAEFGRALGGIANVITYSGSNRFEAKAFGFFSDNRFAGQRQLGFVETRTGDFASYDAGASLGGPIVRDKLWYFLAYNVNVDKEDIEFEGLGLQTDKRVAHMFAGKLTWQATGKANVIATVFGDPATWDRVGHNSPGPATPVALGNPDPFLGKWETGGINLSLKANYFLKGNFLLEGAASRYDAHTKAEPATERGRTEPQFQDFTSGLWSGGYGFRNDQHSIRSAASLSGTYFLGNHTLKAGFQYENNHLGGYWIWETGSGPDNAGAIVKPNDVAYITLPLDFQPDMRNRVYSLFAQVALTIHPRLRLNPGVRWDGQFFKGLDSNLSGEIPDQIQPRLGITYQLGKIGSQKISAFYGRFYEQIPTRPLSFFYSPLVQKQIVYFQDPNEDPSGGILVLADHILPEQFNGQYYDEFSLGYERRIGRHFKAVARGTYRTLREIVELAGSPESTPVSIQNLLGNPGKGVLSFVPGAERDYSAIELSLEKSRGGKLNFFASYVLSRSHGNYTGLYSSDTGQDGPHQTLVSRESNNASGLLPNDRTQVFKFNGSYNFDFGLTSGISFIWQTGTPLSEFGGVPGNPNPFAISLVSQRGTVGRTPAIWDLNLRFAYHLGKLFHAGAKQKLILDIFHLFSQRKPVHLEQRRFLAVDPETGEQTLENPNYLKPLRYQLPTTVRLGLEIRL